MRFNLSATIIALLVAGLSVVPAQAQAPKATNAEPVPYSVPRTPWGDPDLQGLWPGTFEIPLERDPKFGNRLYLTDEEYRQKVQESQNRQQLDRAGGEVLTGKEVIDTRSPPYWEEYPDPHRQTSHVVDPPDGKIPALTPRAAKIAAEWRVRDATGEYNSYLDFNMWQRCISRSVVTSMISSGYNAGNQILQAPGYVIVRNEMIHEARVIYLDGRPQPGPGVSMYMGYSRGRWEGDTLVVETSNLNGKTELTSEFSATSISSPGFVTSGLRLTERFTRTGPNQLVYEVTISDPATWARPWTIRHPYTADPSYTLYEYACHEANYGLENTLAGDRAKDSNQTP